MRFVLTALLWLLTTVALAVALPAAWAQQNVVDVDGYAAFAQRAAADPAVQEAVAAELTTQLVTLAANSGYDVRTDLFGVAGERVHPQCGLPRSVRRRSTGSRTAGCSPTRSSSPTRPGGGWSTCRRCWPTVRSSRRLQDFGIQAPSSLRGPADRERARIRCGPASCDQLATWGPWVSVGATMLAGVSRTAHPGGRPLAAVKHWLALGVSALLVGAAGWAGLEVGRRYLNTALNNTTGEIRQIADALVSQAIVGSMHQWLNLTLAVGGVLVVLGVIVTLLGGIGHRPVREPALG